MYRKWQWHIIEPVFCGKYAKNLVKPKIIHTFAPPKTRVLVLRPDFGER